MKWCVNHTEERHCTAGLRFPCLDQIICHDVSADHWLFKTVSWFSWTLFCLTGVTTADSCSPAVRPELTSFRCQSVGKSRTDLWWLTASVCSRGDQQFCAAFGAWMWFTVMRNVRKVYVNGWMEWGHRKHINTLRSSHGSTITESKFVPRLEMNNFVRHFVWLWL